MIVERTEKYREYLKNQFNEKPETENFFDTLNGNLIDLQKHLHDLKLALEKHCIPSFSKRKKIKDEIDTKRCTLNFKIVQLENKISEIREKKCYSKKMLTILVDYYACKLNKTLVEYKNVEEKYLKKITTLKVFDECDYDYNDNDNDQQLVNEMILMKRSADAEHVRKVIFFITTMIMEMKMVVSAQNQKIDRIEVQFDTINENLKNTNVILAQMPRKHNRIKNRIISFLSFLVLILITLSILKALKHRKGIGIRKNLIDIQDKN
ncbi:hypothetical protein EDEG_01911 [Edhazardia aedis USNM 41457]|uniref:t-SNARE coiled-coil homology domain-containing protein n=1 Tax=Edhazardia aedis (strain USNM 41457) TaxID=1003232 RepID=J9D8H0_EDHAE|nr:hypothetical protein EDEG_01911 [Edhazardia aedis USNM 41457]|eukprot:EJW03819.1 hypothetical protein EDEG_01911 [Edhazardia aedis USNM 41457]